MHRGVVLRFVCPVNGECRLLAMPRSGWKSWEGVFNCCIDVMIKASILIDDDEKLMTEQNYTQKAFMPSNAHESLLHAQSVLGIDLYDSSMSR